MKKKIGEILIAHEVISAEDIGVALALQADGDPARLGEILLQQGRLEAEALARALAEQKALPYTDLSLVSSSFAQVVPLSFQHRHRLVPFEELNPGEFCIAVADPMAIDAIERAKNWLNAKSIQLYVASSDEIGRVLSAIGDQQLLLAEVVDAPEEELVVAEESSEAPDATSTQQQPALSEEDLFGSLKLDEDEPTMVGGKSLPAEEQQLSDPIGADDLTQIVRRPGPPSAVDADSSAGLEKTPPPASVSLPRLSPFGAQLAELLVDKGNEELADVVIGLADLLVSKSVLSREEVLGIFASPPVEK
jgi:hypothetical protein